MIDKSSPLIHLTVVIQGSTDDDIGTAIAVHIGDELAVGAYAVARRPLGVRAEGGAS